MFRSAAGILFAVVLVAAYLPARRASHTAPGVILRQSWVPSTSRKRKWQMAYVKTPVVLPSTMCHFTLRPTFFSGLLG
jgi:hypothetical protein